MLFNNVLFFDNCQPQIPQQMNRSTGNKARAVAIAVGRPNKGKITNPISGSEHNHKTIMRAIVSLKVLNLRRMITPPYRPEELSSQPAIKGVSPIFPLYRERLGGAGFHREYKPPPQLFSLPSILQTCKPQRMRRIACRRRAKVPV